MIPQKLFPVTYVPARNLMFLSIALSWAETIGASTIFIGVNAIDFSNYPDCRPQFIEAFNHVSKLGTKTGHMNQAIRVRSTLNTAEQKRNYSTGIGIRGGLCRYCKLLPCQCTGTRLWAL